MYELILPRSTPYYRLIWILQEKSNAHDSQIVFGVHGYPPTIFFPFLGVAEAGVVGVGVVGASIAVTSDGSKTVSISQYHSWYGWTAQINIEQSNRIPLIAQSVRQLCCHCTFSYTPFSRQYEYNMTDIVQTTLQGNDFGLFAFLSLCIRKGPGCTYTLIGTSRTGTGLSCRSTLRSNASFIGVGGRL